MQQHTEQEMSESIACPKCKKRNTYQDLGQDPSGNTYVCPDCCLVFGASRKHCSGEWPCEASMAAAYLEQELETIRNFPDVAKYLEMGSTVDAVTCVIGALVCAEREVEELRFRLRCVEQGRFLHEESNHEG